MSSDIAPSSVTVYARFFLDSIFKCVQIGRQSLVGLTRLELVTSPLSGVRSNRLSYRPVGGGF
jgi:hypothetical protein